MLILKHDATDVRLGGGANAVHNIRTLGGSPLPFGVLGRDAHGRRLRALLCEKGIAASGVVDEAAYPTPVRSRILAGRAHSTKQQVVRLDRYAPLPTRSAARRAVEQALRSFRGPVDGVLVSDYGCGLLDAGLVRAAVAFARRRRIPVTGDSRFALLHFRGMTAGTPVIRHALDAFKSRREITLLVSGDRLRRHRLPSWVLKSFETKIQGGWIIERPLHGVARPHDGG